MTVQRSVLLVALICLLFYVANACVGCKAQQSPPEDRKGIVKYVLPKRRISQQNLKELYRRRPTVVLPAFPTASRTSTRDTLPPIIEKILSFPPIKKKLTKETYNTFLQQLLKDYQTTTAAIRICHKCRNN